MTRPQPYGFYCKDREGGFSAGWIRVWNYYTGKAYKKMARVELDARWDNVNTLIQPCLKV